MGYITLYDEIGKIIKARVWQKTDTLPNWLANTNIIGPGEGAFIVSEDGQPINFKLGDGTKTFSELPYWIQYDQAAYIPTYTATPTQPVAYTIVGAGTYGSITVGANKLAVLGWDGSAWFKNVEIDLPKINAIDGFDSTSITDAGSANNDYILNNRFYKESSKIYNMSSIFPTNGISGGNKYDLATALNVLQANITANFKDNGQNYRISFLNVNNLNEEYVYMGGGFSSVNRWVSSVYIDKNLGDLYGMFSANVISSNTESLNTTYSVNAGDRIYILPLNNVLTLSTIRVDNGSMIVQKSNIDTTKSQYIDINTTGTLNILSNSNNHLSGLVRFLVYKVLPISKINDDINQFKGIESSVLLNNNTFSKAYTNNRLFNDAIRELYIIGGDYPNKVYRIELIRNRTSDNRWSVTLLQNDVIVSRYNTTTVNPESIQILFGNEVDSSGIKFYAVINWQVLANNTTYSLANGYNIILNELCFDSRFNPLININIGGQGESSAIPTIEVLDPKNFTESISSIAWSGFIDLSDIEDIIYNLQRVNGNTIMYFYQNDRSYYTSNLLAAEYIVSQSASSRAIGRISVPKGYKWMSFRSSDINNDKVILVKNPSKNAYDFKKIEKILSRGVSISDTFFPASSEPNLIYDNVKGIVYANFISGDNYTEDPNGNFSYVRFPLTQPWRGVYAPYFKFNSPDHLIDGYQARWRDTMPYFHNGGIRNVTFGDSTKTASERAIHFFDQTLEGVYSNFTKCKWLGTESSINYDTYIQKITDAGLTPYGLTGSEITNPHYKELWVSSSKIQEYGGYKYFTLNATADCPMICRTNDDFVNIELVKAFQIKGSYESSLIINGSDWYYVIRSGSGCYYANSVDAGVTWSDFTLITNSTSSKPRGILYDGKIVFMIPTSSPENFGGSQTQNKNGVATRNRYSVKFIRGDKNIPINNWTTEVVLASKYGINYSDVISVGKDIYFAYSCDKTHLSQIPTSGKSQVMFTRIGNLDDNNLFGDI